MQPTDPLIGRTVGRYRVEQLIGRGGTGSVYLATDTTLDRRVAFKTLHTHLADQPRIQERFLHEARSIAQLEHPNIVQVFDFDNRDGYLYLVMPHLDSGSLRDYFYETTVRGGRLDLREVVYLVRQVARALQYAHQQRLIHRDIKPGNVLLRKTVDEMAPSPYDAVLADFGIAVLALEQMMTANQIPEGTIPYMSPEQCNVEERSDRRSDLYSLGVMLYELATGQLPYDIKNLQQAIRIHNQPTIPRPSAVRPDVPALLDHITTQCLQKKPDDRYYNAGALLNDLNLLYAELNRPQGSAGGSDGIQTAQEGANADPMAPIRQDTMLDGEITQTARIIWRTRDGDAGEYRVEQQTVVIGRAKEADLTINDNGVSRRHAQLTRRSDGRYELRDLGSRNGVYWPNSDQRLTQAVIVSSGQELLLGQNVRLLFELGGVSDATAPQRAVSIDRTDEQPAVPSRYDSMQPATEPRRSVSRPETGQQVMTAEVEQGNFEIEAGAYADFIVAVRNTSPRVEHFQITLAGVPSGWVQIIAQADLNNAVLKLSPGAEARVIARVSPPRQSSSLAGRYPLKLTLTPRAQPAGAQTLDLSLGVLPFYSFVAELTPQVLRPGRDATVTIRHQGNSPTPYALTVRDTEDSVQFGMGHPNLTLDPRNPVATVTLKHAPRRRRLLGSERQVQFTLTAAERITNGNAQMLSGQVVLRPRFPQWIVTLIIPLLLLLCGGLFALVLDPDGDGSFTWIADACPNLNGEGPTGCPLTATATYTPTLTPSNTPTLTNTPVPLPTTPSQATLRVITDRLNVRNGPGTAFEVVGELAQGQQIPIIGQNGNWLQVSFGGGTAWVCGQAECASFAELSGPVGNVPFVVGPATPTPTFTPTATATTFVIVTPAPIITLNPNLGFANPELEVDIVNPDILVPVFILPVSLNTGFFPQPFERDLTTGDEIAASTVGDATCRGYINNDPSLTLNWGGGPNGLAFDFEAADSADDPVLVIERPNGTVQCNDDRTFDRNSRIRFENASTAGTYRIWVGSFAEGQRFEGTLFISEGAG